MFVACGIWCVADVSSVSGSSSPEQTVGLWVCMVLHVFYKGLGVSSVSRGIL